MNFDFFGLRSTLGLGAGVRSISVHVDHGPSTPRSIWKPCGALRRRRGARGSVCGPTGRRGMSGINGGTILRKIEIFDFSMIFHFFRISGPTEGSSPQAMVPATWQGCGELRRSRGARGARRGRSWMRWTSGGSRGIPGALWGRRRPPRGGMGPP